MSSGGFRFTYGARLLFDQNVQTYVRPSGEVHEGPRPAPEPWILSYCAAASGVMLAGAVGLLAGRRWGLTCAGFAGLAWVITAIGYLYTMTKFMEKMSRWPNRSALGVQIYWVIELGIEALAISVGVLFVTLYWRPAWAGFEARNSRFAQAAFLAWGLISIASSTIFARWYLARV